MGGGRVSVEKDLNLLISVNTKSDAFKLLELLPTVMELGTFQNY